MRLQDKGAIITGAANGLGFAAAEIFAREGAKVALTDYNVEQGKYKASELREKGYEVTFFQVDVHGHNISPYLWRAVDRSPN